ncbi:MAG: hypothetical protein JNG89_19560, partial [Planctomycetaceae bacterium]|nr:hypothetical protein [Planctomycetaceae bacterium]
DPHDVLSGLVERVATAKSLLARVPEIKFPIQEGDLKGVNVVLSREDLREFFSRHQQEMSGLVNRLRPHAGTVAGPLRSVVVVCGDGEFAPLNELLQDLLGEAEPLPTTVIADGAALAARTIKPSRRAKQSPVLTLATRFVKRHSDVLKLAALSTTAAAADAPPAGNWEIAARQLIAAGETNEARQYLQRVIYRATQILESLPGGASRASQAPAPESQRSAIWTPDKGRLFTAEPAAPPRPQPLAEAEAILENARQILERSRGSVEKIRDAVGLSHLADQRVAGVGIQEKHHILLGVVDVHCRAAELLEGPQNFDVAIEKLQCALNHRQNDERVRDRLAARYQAQARYLKDQGEVEQARNMLRMAAKYAFDDTEIWEELDQLDSLG